MPTSYKKNSSPLHQYSDYFREIGLFNKINKFSELENRIKKLDKIPGRTLDQTKGDAFEVFTEAFLNITNKFHIKKVYPTGKVPIKVLSKMKMNILDKGYDGIFITKNGEINSYQVKFLSNNDNLSWSKLSNFIGVSENSKQRLLVSNTNNISDEFLSKDRVLNLNRENLNQININEFKKIETWINKRKIDQKLPSPDTYQNEAIKNIIQEFKKSDRASIIMACGSGKTLVGLWAYEKLKPKLSVIFVPSIGLIKQIRADWLSNTKLNKIRSISICSSRDRSSREDEVKILQKDLDFKITLNPKEIRKFVRIKSSDPKIIFCTYQSSKTLASAIGKIKIDFAIFDEAHRTAKTSKSKNVNLNDNFSYSLFEKNIKINKRLFMTATRRVEDRKNINKEGDAKLSVSMENKEVYGNVCYNLSFFEAAKKNIIAKSKFIISHVTGDEIDRKIMRISKTQVKGTNIKTEQVANQIAIKKAANKYKIDKIFSFHTTVQQAKSFTRNSPEGIVSHMPNFFTTHINGEMRTRLRDARMQEFRENQKGLISNSRCLIEGIDVPEVSMVVFANPKQSEIDIVQATGRALRNRNQKNKKFGYVLIPIFTEKKKGESEYEAIEKTDYVKVAEVIKAMSEHDMEIKQILTDLLISESRGKGFVAKAQKKFEERFDVIHPSVSKKVLLKNIKSKTVTRLITKWDVMIGMLLAYKDKHSNCNVPFNYEENLELGRWVHSVRKRRLNSTLYDYQITQLNKLGFSWKLEGEDRSKDTKYLYLKDLAKKHGNDLGTFKRKIKKLGLKVVSGYKKFKSDRYSRGISFKSYYVSKKDFEEIEKSHKIVDKEKIKDLIKSGNYFKEDDFFNYCGVTNRTFYNRKDLPSLKPDFVYLQKPLIKKNNKLNFYGKIFHKNKKYELEKILGFKIIKFNEDVVDWETALKMGCDGSDFSDRKKYRSKPKKIIPTTGYCEFPDKTKYDGFSFKRAYSRKFIKKFLLDYKKISLSKKEIVSKKLIEQRELSKQLYELTSFSTVYFKALKDKLLIPLGRGLRIGKKKVINYFPSNEIDNYKKRFLKKNGLKKEDNYIFNFNLLNKYGFISEEDAKKKLGCNTKDIRNLRHSKKLISRARFSTPVGTNTPRHAYKISEVNSFIKLYGKKIKKNKDNLYLDTSLFRYLRYYSIESLESFKKITQNKIKFVGFFIKLRFKHLIKKRDLLNFLKKFKDRKSYKDIIPQIKKL